MKRLLLVMLAAVALAGCADPPEDRYRTRGDRILGLGSEEAEDPVSGAMILKEKAVKRSHRGTTYYFETMETAEIFDRRPEAFAIPENPPVDVR